MNHHATEAEHLNIDASTPDLTVGLTERRIAATRALTEATLAVAYEHRTGNLIAFLESPAATQLKRETRGALEQRIVERLQSDIGADGDNPGPW